MIRSYWLGLLPSLLFATSLASSGCNSAPPPTAASTASVTPTVAGSGATAAQPASSATTAPASPTSAVTAASNAQAALPTLANVLAHVVKIRVTKGDGEPPFQFARASAIIAGDDLKQFAAALGPDTPATDGGPRCLYGLSAELLGAGDAKLGVLGLFCAGTQEPSVRDADPSRSWRMRDPVAVRALLERIGNGSPT